MVFPSGPHPLWASVDRIILSVSIFNTWPPTYGESSLMFWSSLIFIEPLDHFTNGQFTTMSDWVIVTSPLFTASATSVSDFSTLGVMPDFHSTKFSFHSGL